MSAMTDRISNKDLVNLAKQQYEQNKRNSIPSEVIRLVSRGMVYPKDHPLRNGTIEMRYMTAYDEDILTNPSYMREGIVLDKLLQALIITPVDYSTIARVDKNGLIISARVLSYGKDYPVIVTDPKTNNKINRVVDLTKLEHTEFNLVSDDNGEFDYKLDNGTELKFKFLQNSDDNNSIKISSFLEQTICQINDKRDKEFIANFIRYEFFAKDSKKFRDYINTNTPSITTEYTFEGEDGSTFTAGFPIGGDLFWF
jgi:hypothetical protein